MPAAGDPRERFRSGRSLLFCSGTLIPGAGCDMIPGMVKQKGRRAAGRCAA